MNTDWSFGIIYGSDCQYLQEVIQSIRKQNIPNYEIILVGDSSIPEIQNIEGEDIVKIDFDESIKPLWITKKKNIISQCAKYENVSVHHDYTKLDDNWYSEFCKFDTDWDVCMTSIKNLDGLRFRDWVFWRGVPVYADYYSNPDTSEMYVSGTYFCIKREYFLQYPFDESLLWGQGEDGIWSFSMRDNWRYKCNPNSIVHCCKQKTGLPTADTNPNKEL